MIVCKDNNRSIIQEMEKEWDISIFISLKNRLMSLFIQLTKLVPEEEFYIERYPEMLLISNSNNYLISEFAYVVEIIKDGMERQVDVLYEAVKNKNDKVYRYNLASTIHGLKANIKLETNQILIIIPFDKIHSKVNYTIGS